MTNFQINSPLMKRKDIFKSSWIMLVVDHSHVPIPLWCIVTPDVSPKDVFCIKIKGDANVSVLKEVIKQNRLPFWSHFSAKELTLFDVSDLSIKMDGTSDEHFGNIELGDRQYLYPDQVVSTMFPPTADKRLNVVVKLPITTETQILLRLLTTKRKILFWR
ncbi:hypothetical protein AX15_006562 [Amanita polypyramis BW_CC]|nr:hypothetical protein AX15_006562 [Amanita polypyramis BW_CC]